MKIGLHKAKKAGADADLPPMPAPSGGRNPSDRVASLSAQGMSDPEIIRTLRSEGYSPMEVDSAMKDALRSAVRPSGPRMMPPAPPMGGGGASNVFGQRAEPQRRMIFGDEDDMQPPPRRMPEPPFTDDDLGGENDLELPRLPGVSAPRRAPAPLPVEEADIEDMEPVGPAPKPSSREDKLQKRREFEEIAEGIVDERVAAMEKRVDDIADRMKELNVRINNIQQAMDRTQGERRGDIAEITEKIESYRQGINDMSTRMESVERTMKDSMTPMMQSLRSLSDAVKAFKETRGGKY
jgi:prefoldin subunit 5